MCKLLLDMIVSSFLLVTPDRCLTLGLETIKCKNKETKEREHDSTRPLYDVAL